jgi:non-ribosomal peptide synthetase component F
VRVTVTGAFEHQDFPHPLLVERLTPTRDGSYGPLIQVMFVLQKGSVLNGDDLAAFGVGDANAVTRLGDLRLTPVPFERGVAPFDVAMILAEAEGGRLAGSIQYKTDLFDDPTIERMTGHYLTLLDSAATYPTRRVSSLPLLTGAETRQLDAWSAIQPTR